MVTAYFWCERLDLNPYESPHTPLKRARLPIPPLSLNAYEYIKSFALCQEKTENFSKKFQRL